MIRLLYSFVAVAFFLNAIPSSLFAEEASPIKTGAPAEVNGVLNCFDYYRFGSVQAVMTPSVMETVTGSSITFSGKLANANEYPIVDGTLYAKVLRNDETTFAAGDGNLVIDQFVVQDNIALIANGTIDIAHEWRIPANAKAGDYYIAYFFVANDRYDLMGLSFTDNVVGNTASFSVSGEEGIDSPAELSKVATTLNGINHNFTADSITFKKGEKIIVSTTITNSSNETKILPLQWNQYAWDAMSADNRRNTKTEIVTLAPQETKTVSYEVKPQRENVVYLTVITQDKDAKSILNIRYVQDGIEGARLNFPGVSAFPFVAGESVTLFSCAHSINSPVVEGNTLTLELLDKAGASIYSYTYKGTITSEMAGFGESFIPNASYEYVTLNAKIERAGVVVEEVSVVYDCAATSECDTQAEDIMAVGSSTSVQQIILIMVGLGSLIVIFIVIVVFFRRKGVSDISKPTIMSIFVLFLLSAGMFLPQGVEAGVCPFDPPSWDCYTVRTIEGPNMGTEDKFCVPVGTPGPQSSGCFVTSYTTDPDLFQFNTSSVPSDYYSCATNCPAATTATGNVTATNCIIAPNSNSCDASVTWTITNATSPNLHNNTTGNTHSTNASGNAVATPINYGTHSLVVRDGVVQLASTDITASCAAGSTWSGTICVPDGGVCTPMPASIDCYEQRVSYDAWNVHPGLFITTFCVPENDPSPYASGCDIRWELDTTIENFVGTYSDLNAANAAEVARGNPPNVMMCPGDYCAAPLAPSADLTINSSNGPIIVNNGDLLSLVWNSSNAASCTAFGAGWGSGTAVALGGSAAIYASVSDTYIVNCGGVIDSVVVIVNAGSAPNAPTIIGPTTSGAGINNTFLLNAIDVDGDNIYYEIDWNNDGTIDAYTPGVGGYVPSGTDRTAARTWPTGGSYTFSVRATDDTGLTSATTTHTVVVSTPPLVTIESQVNNTGGWGGADQTINPGDTLNILWTSTGATSCTNNFGVAGNATNNSGVSVTSPAPNSSLTYSVTCTGPGGTVVDDIIVRTNNLPNLTEPTVNHSISAATVDPVTGEYDSFEVYFQTGNDGESPAGASTYRIDISNGAYSSSQTGVLPAIGAGGSVNISRLFDNVPLGSLTVIVTVDSNSVVTEVYENDNVGTYYPILTPQKPLNFDITATPDVVREGQSATIGWDVGVTYSLDCTVSGPGLTPSPYTFNPSVDGRVGSEVTGPLSAKSEYLLSCTESITNTTFTETVSVEVVPTAEEV